MIFGSRFFGIDTIFEWIKQLDVVIISVEYRLAPEFPDPLLIEDCDAGLKWLGENIFELGINPEKLTIWNFSRWWTCGWDNTPCSRSRWT